MPNFISFSNQNALITGASSGIGAATARLFAQLGARVAIGYNRNAQGAGDVQKSIKQAGGEAISIQAEMLKPSEIGRMVQEAATKLGPIDILVNNAGSLLERVTFEKMTEERWDEVISLNLKSAMLAAQAVAPGMISRKRGNITSTLFRLRDAMAEGPARGVCDG